uniref:Uncharacterized protein n=1 Tax=Nicotiana tabacum TaxID=4097 RepID=A0A1S3X2N5_TOBAC|nr:PREDICTED: uncharacterized protein LOC107760679 [Nicotiana tabacum]
MRDEQQNKEKGRMVDLWLPPIYAWLPPNCSSGLETVCMARSLLFAQHAGERILRCWGGGTGWLWRMLRIRYKSSLRNLKVVVFSVKLASAYEIGMPFFNHEVVKKALVMAIEKKNERILDLLQVCGLSPSTR